MGKISEKLVYLNGTKQAIKQAINEDFEVIDDNTTFREYADEISSNNAKYKDLIPKETTNATNTLDISNSSGLDKALVTQYGNTYQEGEPTPDTPQEIVNISGKSTLKDVGKNLLKYPYRNTTKTTNGITFTDLGDGTIKVNGTATANTYFYLSAIKDNYYKNMHGQTLRLIGCPSGGSNSTYRLVFATDNWIGGIDTGSGSNFVVEDTYYNQVFIQVYNGTTVNNLIFKPMLTTDTSATMSDYEPYQGQSFDLDLPFELCKIGDYKDRIYPLNGKWYLEKKIDKAVLNGSESGWYSWYNTSNDNIGFYNYLHDIIAIGNYEDNINGKAFCNMFSEATKRVSIANGEVEQYKICGSNGRSYLAIGIDKTKLNDYSTQALAISNFKTWLSTHNTTVYYILNTPTTEEITESNYPTLYEQLNDIKLYEGVNHITMTNESGLDVEFDITYYKDWKLD